MVWTAPATWVAGEVVTADDLNEQVRDNLKAIGDPWTSYSPTWSGSSVNPAIGNGSLTGAYMQAGKLVAFRVSITMGSTTTYGTGTWRLTLPVTPTNHRWTFLVDYFDNGTARRQGSALWAAAGYIDLHAPDTSAGGGDRGVTATIPHTWADTDVLFVTGTYEAA